MAKSAILSIRIVSNAKDAERGSTGPGGQWIAWAGRPSATARS